VEGLVCEGREGYEPVPGCDGDGRFGYGYCRYPDAPSISPSSVKTPTTSPTHIPSPTFAQEVEHVGDNVGDERIPAEAFPLGNCQGDCDNNGDCQDGLVCFRRWDLESVPGCSGVGSVSGDDICCVVPDNYLNWRGQNRGPDYYENCEGPCEETADCVEGLVCEGREGYEPVPGCDGDGRFGYGYCRYPDAPSISPSSVKTPSTPTYAPNTFGATYVPGDLSVSCDDGKLLLSRGLSCKRLSKAGEPIEYSNGTFSTEVMHKKADGAGVFPHPIDNGWYYVSNSEVFDFDGGGVGTFRFDENGEVIGYERTLINTSRNCGGGRTYWDTWVSCEENTPNGTCHEVNPHTGYTSQINNVALGGNYESFAYDDADPDVNARFFTTEDINGGKLTRYTPHPSAFQTSNPYDILSMPNGTYDYLILNQTDNTFSWSPNLIDGIQNARALFPNTEGIDVHNRILNFISKKNKELYTLDLAAGTWTSSSTLSGAFDLQPDQLGRIIGDHDMLYFCEDGGADCDIHARDATGQYFTILKGVGYETETTGLAFSPNNKFMYVAFWQDSNIYSIWREDGLPFNGEVAYTKYHAT